jgi:septation ring formation regulator EzrA
MNRQAIAQELVKLAKSLTAEEDAAVVVYHYLMDGSKKDIVKMKSLVDDIDDELKSIRQQLAGMDKLGSGKIEAQSLLPNLRKALAPLKSYVDTIDANAKKFSR